MRYERFHLVLMVTHRCNLHCDYCYVGAKIPRSMGTAVGRCAIDRAIESLQPGGVLELGFFGGEPLLEANRVGEFLDYAAQATAFHGIALRAGMTTNATDVTSSAWELLLREDLDIAVSHDGLPEVHDRHRRRADGCGSAEHVLATIDALRHAGKEVRVVTVVRPDGLRRLPEAVRWLYDRGIRQIDLTLDVWADWDARDMRPLEDALAATAEVWRARLPHLAVNWFDEKAAHLLQLSLERTARCAFGDGQIAVSPRGHFYPCERLIGEDRPDNPMRIAGDVQDGGDFCRQPAPRRHVEACSACAIQGQCNTTCRCNNYVRTGDVARPDALLCLLDRVCYRETAGALAKLLIPQPLATGIAQEKAS